MTFDRETDFENALINLLFEKGWSQKSSDIKPKPS